MAGRLSHERSAGRGPRQNMLSVLLQIPRRFFWSSPAVTSSGPHIRDATSVQRLWNYFVIASLPAWLIGLWSLGRQTNYAIADFGLESVPGWRAEWLEYAGFGFDAFNVMDCFMHGLLYFMPIFLVALLVGAVWECVFSVLRRRPLDEGLLVIAWFFALLLPATASMFHVVLGMSFGIVVGKLIFGGSGRYLINPALLGVAFLVFSYPTLLFGVGAWVPVEAYDQPTVLELVMEEGGLKVISSVDYSWLQLFIGDRPGAVGVVSTLGALLGALFLVATGMASWRVMLGALIGLTGTVLIFNAVAPDNVLYALPWHWQIILGGFVFGVVFIATDPVAGPMTDPGRWGFGLLVGGLTAIIRVANPSYYEGVMFAILLACMFSPLIDFVVTELNIRRRRIRIRKQAGE
jgi:Na+-transporting NADH:ubiquinone oxidoreductase subunit B